MAEISYREALNQALREEMNRDERVFIIGEEVGYSGGVFQVTEGLLAVYGEQRVRDAPLSQLAIVGAGIGAAMGGLRPIVELRTTNAGLLALDQIVNHAAKIHYLSGGRIKVPLVIRIPQGVGQNLEAYFLHCPGLRVAMPATPADAKGLLKTALRHEDPVMFLEHESLYQVSGEVPEGEHLVPFGKANMMRNGKDVTLVSYSQCVHDSMRAAEALATAGVEAEVIDLRTLNPLDIETVVESVRKTRRAIVAHEGWKTGGAGAEIAAQIQQLAFEHLDAPVQRVATLDLPALPGWDNIVKAAETMTRPPRRLV